jgi:hypothetical protein
MTRDQVKAILDRVLTWPPERQADVARVVEVMEEQDKSDLRLTEEQAAEVRRRLADPNRKTIPAEDVFEIRSCYGRTAGASILRPRARHIR